MLGLFANGNMTTEFGPLFARTEKFQKEVDNDPNDVNSGSPTFRCKENNRPANEPSLPAMTEKAIDLLEEDEDGFVLQVEGASIDKRDHAADACGQIGELLAFDDAVGVALEFQREHPDTLVIVTADHAHTSQIVSATEVTPGEAAPAAPGASYATLQTVDAAPIRVVYGTADTGDNPAATGGSQAHTGATVPVWAGRPAGGQHPGHDRPDGHLRCPNRENPEPGRVDRAAGRAVPFSPHRRERNRGSGPGCATAQNAKGGGTSRKASEAISAIASAVPKPSRWPAWKNRWSVAVSSQARRRPGPGCGPASTPPRRRAPRSRGRGRRRR